MNWLCDKMRKCEALKATSDFQKARVDEINDKGRPITDEFDKKMAEALESLDLAHLKKGFRETMIGQI